MSCYLTVRASDGIKQWNFDDWTAMVAIAALSAEPYTLDDLMDAMRRYQPEHHHPETARSISNLESASRGDAWCLIDLVGRTLVAGGEYELPDLRGAYEPLANEPADGFPIVWLDTPSDWLFRPATAGWQSELESRWSAALRSPRIDARAILYGEPLLEFLADEALKQANEAARDDDKSREDRARALHARWMLTVREDLGGRSPRQVLLAERERIQHDLEHRALQWSRQGHAAHALSTTSSAYRVGGFGTTELVLYFDLVRSLLNKSLKLIGKRNVRERGKLLDQLVQHRDSWLQQPYEDGEMRMSAQALIESERRRIPIVGERGTLDCDCPICRAEAEGVFGSSPMFLWFDGHHLELEDEFAFSMIESYDEWRDNQQCYATMEEEIQQQGSEWDREQNSARNRGPFDESVWKSTFVDWEQISGPGSSPEQTMFALAFPVAELVSDLKQLPKGRDQLKRLNNAYDDLRRAADPASRTSAARHLGERLEELCQSYPELTSKCADLQSHLDEVVRRLV